MKANELRNKSISALNNELIELRREQFNLRMQHGVGQSPRSDRFKKVRRDIARVKTIINEKTATGASA